MKAFFAKVWNAIKGAFSKAWAWSIGHKVIAIAVAATVVVGTTCAIVLPIALHNHKFAEAWCSDAENHWHAATCKHEEEKSDLAAHTFDNDCDAKCDVCGYERTVGAHTYDNACDTTCNTCGATRTVDPHNHATTWTAGETTHWYACSVCGDKKDEAAHTFDKTVAHSDYLKAEATATTKAQYWKSCVCGKASATEYFETDKTAATLTDIQDLSKTYDKVELANPTYTTNSDVTATFEWYQGETKLTAKPVNAGTYKVKVIIAESATYTGISVEREFTIAKRTIWATDVEFAYWGFDNFYGDQATAAVTFENLANGDTLDAGDVWFKMTGINAGSTLAGIYFDGAGNNITDNYEFDLSKCSASIVPKVLNVSKTFEYIGSGFDERQLHAPDASLSGVIAGDELYIEILFESGNAGALVLTGEDAPYLDGADCDNYTLGTCEFSIVPKTLNYLELTKVYNGKEGFNDSFDRGHVLGTDHGVVSGDVVILGTNDDIEYNVGTYVLSDSNGNWSLDDSCYLVGADADNYQFNYKDNGAVATVTVTPKALTGSLILDVCYGDVKKLADSDLYYYDQVISETEYGVLTGDSVTIRVLYANPNAGTADTSFAIYGESNYAIGDLSVNNSTISQKVVTELPATLTAEYKNLLGLTEGLEAPVEIDGIEATLIFVAKKSDNNNLYTPGRYANATLTEASLGDNFDLQIDANAKYTITVTQKKISALDIKITEAQYETGEFTLIPSKDGVYHSVKVIFSKSNTQDVAVGTVFELVTDSANFAQGREVVRLPNDGTGDYYCLAPDANGIVGTITIVPDHIVLDCQSEFDESYSLDAGDVLYVVVNGAEGTMNDFEVQGDMDDEVRFTYSWYADWDAVLADTPFDTEENTNYVYKDVNGTDDAICVITITTGGSITIKVVD